MNAQEFISELKDVLGTSMRIEPETVLSDIPEWDSLAMMSVVTLLASQFGSFVTLADLKECVTVLDIVTKAGDAA